MKIMICVGLIFISGCVNYPRIKKDSNKEIIQKITASNAKMDDCQGSFYKHRLK